MKKQLSQLTVYTVKIYVGKDIIMINQHSNLQKHSMLGIYDSIDDHGNKFFMVKIFNPTPNDITLSKDTPLVSFTVEPNLYETEVSLETLMIVSKTISP